MSKNTAPQPHHHGTDPRTLAFPHLAVSITAESNALAAATTANWLDVTDWRTALGQNQSPLTLTPLADEQWFAGFPAFEIDIEADAAETLQSVSIYAVRLGPVTIADDTFTSSGSDAINTAVAHGMLTGDGPFRLTTSDTLPGGLSLATDYYVEKTAADTFELYTTRALAIASGGGIATTDSGTGTHTIADVQSSENSDNDTRRCRFTLVGSLNEGSNIVVGAQVAYMERINHSPLDLYYMLVATETSAQTVTVRITPIWTYLE